MSKIALYRSVLQKIEQISVEDLRQLDAFLIDLEKQKGSPNLSKGVKYMMKTNIRLFTGWNNSLNRVLWAV